MSTVDNSISTARHRGFKCVFIAENGESEPASRTEANFADGIRDEPFRQSVRRSAERPAKGLRRGRGADGERSRGRERGVGSDERCAKVDEE